MAGGLAAAGVGGPPSEAGVWAVGLSLHLCFGTRASGRGDVTECTEPYQLVSSSPPTSQVSLFSLSPTHAPWLLAHKIQSPQEKEALYALTVSLAWPCA